MSKCGQVVQEGGGRCVNVHTYVYLYIYIHYIHTYMVPAMILCLLIKYWKIQFLLSVTPAFVYFLERGQHEHS